MTESLFQSQQTVEVFILVKIHNVTLAEKQNKNHIEYR